MLYIIAIFICIFNLSLYSQFDPAQKPTFSDFAGRFLYENLEGKNYSAKVINSIAQNKEMNELYENAINSFTQTELINILSDPKKMLLYTTNESAILLAGLSLAAFENIKAESEINPLILDKIKRRSAFLTSTGDNYGMIIPMRIPLLSLGVGIYTDIPINKNDKSKTEKNNYYGYENLLEALDSVPIPYLQFTSQINLWTLPISIALRGGFILGFKELYKLFVRDADIESSGFHIGGEIKTLIWRNDYFFADFRLNLNYDKGKIKTILNKSLYVPIRLGYLGGTDTGVMFNSASGFEALWSTFAVSPKITIGFKMKEKVPGLHYLGLSLSISYDAAFVKASSRTFVASSKAYANIEGYTKTITDFKFPDFNDSFNSYIGDIRISLNFDIFYMTFSFEYAVFSKMYAVLFTPLLFRF